MAMMSLLPKVVYGFKAIVIRIPGVLLHMDRLFLNCIWKGKCEATGFEQLEQLERS